jgi:polyisoprenoid-binding protein YceI
MSGMLFGAKRAIVVVASALSLAASAAAAQTAPKWVIDPAHSQLVFESSAEGASFEGRFQTWDADIRFDPKQLGQSKVVVTVDTDSAVTGDTSRDQTAHGSDWFSAAMFPKATFTTKSFKDLGGGKYEADGDLSIRGVSQPVSLPFTLTINGEQASMTGETTLDRTLFGVGQGEYGSADIVPFEVKVQVSIQAALAK